MAFLSVLMNVYFFVICEATDSIPNLGFSCAFQVLLTMAIQKLGLISAPFPEGNWSLGHNIMIWETKIY